MDHNHATDPIEIGSNIGVRIAGVDDIPAHYVNLISSNFDQAAFQVVFAQLMPPIVMRPEDAEELTRRGFVEARALARVVLTPVMLEQTIQNLTAQLENFKRQLTEENNGSGND